MLRSEMHTGFCLHHLRRWLRQNDVEPRKPRPLAAPGTLDNPWAVRRALKRVAQELAEGKIAPEQARAVASIGRLLLISTRRPAKRRPRHVSKSGVGRQAAG